MKESGEGTTAAAVEMLDEVESDVVRERSASNFKGQDQKKGNETAREGEDVMALSAPNKIASDSKKPRGASHAQPGAIREQQPESHAAVKQIRGCGNSRGCGQSC